MTPSGRAGAVTVVKVGGALAAIPGALATAGEAIAGAARERPLVILPGGGPFADQVRRFDREHGLSPTAAHWMAILGMDQYAWALAERIPGGRVVEDRPGILGALSESAVPVLAPSRWLRAADELPHGWDVTSDSLAAYLAMLLDADHLVLIKPVSGGADLTDPYFRAALAHGTRWRVVGLPELSPAALLAE